ncbi:MAG: hypothetical protein CVU05_03100 [Bacteroidetes bacterium HGW-Bacteroidetes-21]|jgi:ABC-type multidrug transport system ATPase subunit|nr:MAG: hypothetical protein CVU05_03100 [Bacteroidetes bacterium HGW-Bacteroidetes-21]
MSNDAIVMNNISLAWEDKVIVEDFSCIVPFGSKTVLVAPSGKGKTTLLHAVAGFVKLLKGEIIIDGKKLISGQMAKIRSQLAYVPQDFPFSMRVEDFMMLPFSFSYNRHLKFNYQDAIRLMETFLLDTSVMDKPMTEISGGEKQRVALVTAILLHKKILLLDEPVSSLDSNSKSKVIEYISQNNEMTVFSASHDPEWIGACTQKIEL